MTMTHGNDKILMVDCRSNINENKNRGLHPLLRESDPLCLSTHHHPWTRFISGDSAIFCKLGGRFREEGMRIRTLQVSLKDVQTDKKGVYSCNYKKLPRKSQTLLSTN